MQLDEQRKEDLKSFQNLDEDLCMGCNAHGSDKRGLFLDCFYDIQEIIPESLDLFLHTTLRGHYLHICKNCRTEFLTRLEEWWEECKERRGTSMDHDGNPEIYAGEALIPVRENGITKFIKPEDWKEYSQNKRV